MSRFLSFLTVAAALLAGAEPAFAQERVSPPVDSILVEGAVRNTARQVISFSGIQLGQPATYRGIQRAIQGLFATGQFDDVRVDQRQVGDKLMLILVVKERPLLQRWALRGVEKLEEGAVRRKISLPEGRPLDRAAMERSRHAVDSIYRKRGYYAVQVKTLELGMRRLRERDAVGQVAISQGRQLATGVELLGGELADRLEHPEAHVAVPRILLAQQAPGDQRAQPV